MLVLPGDYVGITEEYLPGNGVYADDDRLFSSNTGELAIDKSEHTAKVASKTRIPRMQGVGTVTLGLVADVTDNVAIVDLIPFDSGNISFTPQGTSAVLHVSNALRRYLDSLRTEVKAGDIIRVKIIEVSAHSVRLTIADNNLGVVKAYCSRCRSPLTKKGTALVCGECGSVEKRKMADDYGTGKVM